MSVGRYSFVQPEKFGVLEKFGVPALEKFAVPVLENSDLPAPVLENSDVPTPVLEEFVVIVLEKFAVL